MVETSRKGALVETSALLVAPGLSIVLIAGCGGGGGGGAPTYPGEAAMNAYLQAAHHSTLHATDSAGNAYTLQVDRVPQATQRMFNGTSAYSTADTFTLTKSGSPPAITQSLSFFLLNPYVPVAKVYGEIFGGYYDISPVFSGVVTSSFPLPTTLTVGDSGVVANVTYSSNRTRAVATVDGYESDTYSVTVDTAWTELLCLDAAVSGVTSQGTADGLGSVPETDCYAVDTSGKATLVAVTKTVAGETLTFR